MKLTATVFLVIFVTLQVVTGQESEIVDDLHLLEECGEIESHTITGLLIPENNETVTKIIECMLLFEPVFNEDNILDDEVLKPAFEEILSDQEYFKPSEDLDQVFATCKADLPYTLSAAAQFIKFHNCIVKNYLLEAEPTS